MKSVLIIDDEALMRELLEKFLTGLGYQVDVAKGGMEGILRFDGDHRYNAVLTDIGMPEVDGHDVARYIRNSEKPYIPVMAITGLNELSLEKNLFDSIIEKPFNLEKLKYTLQTLIK